MSIDRYIACMVLGAVGDALGFNNGHWEHQSSGPKIHEELAKLGGVMNVRIGGWRVSDDTVLLLASARALVAVPHGPMEQLLQQFAAEFVEAMKDMDGRSPGITTMQSVAMLRPGFPRGYCIPFAGNGGGCGAAMRTMCIGLRYWRPQQETALIAAWLSRFHRRRLRKTAALRTIIRRVI